MKNFCNIFIFVVNYAFNVFLLKDVVYFSHQISINIVSQGNEISFIFVTLLFVAFSIDMVKAKPTPKGKFQFYFSFQALIKFLLHSMEKF